MGPSCLLGIDSFDPAKDVNLQSLLLLDNGAKAAEDSQNKENVNDPHGFIVPQTQLAFFPGS